MKTFGVLSSIAPKACPIIQLVTESAALPDYKRKVQSNNKPVLVRNLR